MAAEQRRAAIGIDLLPQSSSMPHSEESERAVLGAVLMDPAVASRICSRLQEKDFYLERHRILYRGVRELHDEGTLVDLRTLQAHLEQQGTFEEAGGISLLATLDLDLPDIGRVDAYIDILLDRTTRRAVIELGGKAIRDGLGPAEVEQTLGRIQSEVPQLLAATAKPRLKSLAEILPGFMDQVEDGGVEVLRGIQTGYPDLDALTGGLRAGNLAVIAGRPGLGKSALALNIAQHISLGRAGQPRPVGIWSLEMTQEELLLRMLCSEADVPSERLRAGYLSNAGWRRIVAASRALQAAPLYVDDSGALTVNQIEGRMRRAVDEHGIELAIVDYLQLVGGREGRRAENRNIEVGQVSSALKGLAKELRIPVVVLSQLSRETTRRAGNRPTLADLRESGSIESDADLVVFVHRDAAYDPEAEPGLAEAIVAKSRHSPTGSVSLAWIGETTTFRSLQRQQPVADVLDDEGAPF